MKPLRKCTHCGREAHTEKELEYFAINKPSKHGRQNTCKQCMKGLYKNYHEKHKVAIRLKNRLFQKKFFQAHREERVEYKRQYYKRHPERQTANNKVKRKPMKASCEVCGSKENLHRHHPNYKQPYVFKTLCAICHKLVHVGG